MVTILVFLSFLGIPVLQDAGGGKEEQVIQQLLEQKKQREISRLKQEIEESRKLLKEAQVALEHSLSKLAKVTQNKKVLANTRKSLDLARLALSNLRDTQVGDTKAPLHMQATFVQIDREEYQRVFYGEGITRTVESKYMLIPNANTYLRKIKNSAKADILSAPRIQTDPGVPAKLVVGSSKDYDVLVRERDGSYVWEKEQADDGIVMEYEGIPMEEGAIFGIMRVKVSRVLGTTPLNPDAKYIGKPLLDVRQLDLNVKQKAGEAAVLILKETSMESQEDLWILVFVEVSHRVLPPGRAR